MLNNHIQHGLYFSSLVVYGEVDLSMMKMMRATATIPQKLPPLLTVSIKLDCTGGTPALVI